MRRLRRIYSTSGRHAITDERRRRCSPASSEPLNARTRLSLRANLCALATVTQGWALKFDDGQWVPTYSDFFFFASHSPGKSGWIGNLHSMVEGMNDDVDGFTGQCASQIDSPAGFSVSYDSGLLLRLVSSPVKRTVR
jgi:hypothetical protein